MCGSNQKNNVLKTLGLMTANNRHGAANSSSSILGVTNAFKLNAFWQVFVEQNLNPNISAK